MSHTQCQSFLQGLDIAAKHFLDCESSQNPERQQGLFVGSLNSFLINVPRVQVEQYLSYNAAFILRRH